jgi:hypothetical protein
MKKVFETTGMLKSFDVVNRESAFLQVSPSGSNIKIYHPSYFPNGDDLIQDSQDRLHYGDDSTALQRIRLFESSGTSKGYLGIHADYKSMFGRKVTIRPKYYKNGLINKHQCFVMGNRNKERIAFTAYNCWFESFVPMPPEVTQYQTIRDPSPGIDITRVSWDQLFEL